MDLVGFEQVKKLFPDYHWFVNPGNGCSKGVAIGIRIDEKIDVPDVTSKVNLDGTLISIDFQKKKMHY